jgi:Mycothiol maleylpyruvate isomerase N-terminal domain
LYDDTPVDVAFCAHSGSPECGFSAAREGSGWIVRRQIDNERFPEWQPFADAVQKRRPDARTWCEAWTVRDIVAHQAGNAEELARVLGAHWQANPSPRAVSRNERARCAP